MARFASLSSPQERVRAKLQAALYHARQQRRERQAKKTVLNFSRAQMPAGFNLSTVAGSVNTGATGQQLWDHENLGKNTEDLLPASTAWAEASVNTTSNGTALFDDVNYDMFEVEGTGLISDRLQQAAQDLLPGVGYRIGMLFTEGTSGLAMLRFKSGVDVQQVSLDFSDGSTTNTHTGLGTTSDVTVERQGDAYLLSFTLTPDAEYSSVFIGLGPYSAVSGETVNAGRLHYRRVPNTDDTYVPAGDDRVYRPTPTHIGGENIGVYVNPVMVTNEWLSSSEMDGVEYTSVRVTTTKDDADLGFLGMMSDKVVESTDTNSHYVRQSGFSIVSGQPYTLAAIVKADERDDLRMRFDGNFGAATTADFNLDLATATPGSNSPTVYIEELGAGVYLIGMTAVATATGLLNPQIYLMDAPASTSYTGDGTSGLHIANITFTNTDFVPRPIVTGSAAISRAAQTLSGPAGFFDHTGVYVGLATFVGTLLGNSGGGGFPRVFDISDGTGDDIHAVFWRSTNIKAGGTQRAAAATVSDERTLNSVNFAQRSEIKVQFGKDSLAVQLDDGAVEVEDSHGGGSTEEMSEINFFEDALASNQAAGYALAFTWEQGHNLA